MPCRRSAGALGALPIRRDHDHAAQARTRGGATRGCLKPSIGYRRRGCRWHRAKGCRLSLTQIRFVVHQTAPIIARVREFRGGGIGRVPPTYEVELTHFDCRGRAFANPWRSVMTLRVSCRRARVLEPPIPHGGCAIARAASGVKSRRQFVVSAVPQASIGRGQAPNKRLLPTRPRRFGRRDVCFI